jgi:UDPglucose--hexose-1-phosphate uridylyltransferase
MNPPKKNSHANFHQARTKTTESTANPDASEVTAAACFSHFMPQHAGIVLDTRGIETEIRRDYLNDFYVMVSPNRGRRPYDMHNPDNKLIETALSPKLDKNREIYSLKNSRGDWLVKAVENKFPSLSVDNPQAYGKQEIIIDTPLGNKPLAYLGEAQISTVLEMFQIRTKELSLEHGIEYVMIFHNDGYRAGASLAHAHSQIFALPFVPQKFIDESRIIEEYVKTNNRDPFDDIITYEKRHKVRILTEDERYIVFCPYASQWPFEFWILPKRLIRSTAEIDKTDRTHIARYIKQFCHRLNRHNISYNIYFEDGVSPNHRLCIKICGRSNTWGGFEVATGMVINSVPPESAAKWYKA